MPTARKGRVRLPGEVVAAVFVFWTSGLLVLSAVVFGHSYTRRIGVENDGRSVLDAVTVWDAGSYDHIAADGYRFAGPRANEIAFFPAYPLVGRWVARACGCSTRAALVGVTATALLAALVGLAVYLASATAPPGRRERRCVLLAAAFWPAGCFLRLGYTESLFLLLAVAALLGIRRRWNPWCVAAVVGLATATRSVGVALIVPLAVYAFGVRPDQRWPRRAARVVGLLPLAVWGVLGFAAFQGAVGGDPLAFVKVQDGYRMRPRLPWTQRAAKLASFEPIRAVYTPGSDGYWATLPLSDHNPSVTVNMQFWNPIYFVVAVSLTVFGGVNRWLDRYELTLAAGLLLIPYLTRGYDFGMCSQARFTAVCFPVYIVLGRLLARLPDVARTTVVVALALQMTAWSALFSAGYPIF